MSAIDRRMTTTISHSISGSSRRVARSHSLQQSDAEEKHEAGGQEDRHLEDQAARRREAQEHRKSRRHAGPTAANAGSFRKHRHRQADISRGSAHRSGQQIGDAAGAQFRVDVDVAPDGEFEPADVEQQPDHAQRGDRHDCWSGKQHRVPVDLRRHLEGRQFHAAMRRQLGQVAEAARVLDADARSRERCKEGRAGSQHHQRHRRRMIEARKRQLQDDGKQNGRADEHEHARLARHLEEGRTYAVAGQHHGRSVDKQPSRAREKSCDDGIGQEAGQAPETKPSGDPEQRAGDDAGDAEDRNRGGDLDVSWALKRRRGGNDGGGEDGDRGFLDEGDRVRQCAAQRNHQREHGAADEHDADAEPQPGRQRPGEKQRRDRQGSGDVVDAGDHADHGRRQPPAAACRPYVDRHWMFSPYVKGNLA